MFVGLLVVITAFSRAAELPDTLTFAERRAETLRYGENPHQFGGLYLDPGDHSWIASM